MKESDLWQYLRKGMIGKWHVSRIESSAGNGVPDVSFGVPGINGWIELKYIARWPSLAKTKVKFPLRAEQKHWILNRGAVAGNVWGMVRIEDDFFLLNHEQVIFFHVHGFTKDYWLRNVKHQWHRRIDFNILPAILRRGYSDDLQGLDLDHTISDHHETRGRRQRHQENDTGD